MSDRQTTTTRPSIAAGVAAGMLRLRTDGDYEVADHGDADDRYGCTRDCECILADGHGSTCDLGDREEWAGADELYPLPEPFRAGQSLFTLQQSRGHAMRTGHDLRGYYVPAHDAGVVRLVHTCCDGHGGPVPA